MLKIEMQSYDDLSDEEKAGVSDNGYGKESANYLRVTHNGETVFLESDAMEPEDCRFTRDLSWIKVAIERAYELGGAGAVNREAEEAMREEAAQQEKAADEERHRDRLRREHPDG